MPWSNQGGGGGGGGPFGGGGGGQGPWGRGPSGPQPPNLEELLKKSQDKFKQAIPGGFGSGKVLAAIIIGVLLLWGATGLYRVQPDEQGVVLRFGEFVRTTASGLHWHLPSPIETVITPKVTKINREEVGMRTAGESRSRSAVARDVPEESTMLTGDENIVDMDFTVLWKIRDAGHYLFNIRDPEGTVKIAAESAMREVVGQSTFDNVVTIGRQEIEDLTLELLQTILDDYGAGISVEKIQMQKVDPPGEVIDAFNDVQRARQDKDRLRNEAESYANAIVPKARGDAEQKIQAATAYKERMIKEAEGEAQQFLKVYESYKEAPEVTQRRMYLETLGLVLGNSTKVLIDSNAQGGSSGVVPYLPLPEIQKRIKEPNQ